jgi:hypothetical protein
LIALDCPWTAEKLSACAAARSPQIAIPMVTWMCAELNLSEANKQAAMGWAGYFGRVETMQWLRAESSVPWPAEFVCRYYNRRSVDLSGQPVKGALVCWPISRIRWALANGCGWGNWRCQHYDAAWYNADFTGQARAVFLWAHEQAGCPCTCADEVADNGGDDNGDNDNDSDNDSDGDDAEDEEQHT